MRLHILVEGRAEENLLRGWLPRFLPQIAFNVIPHEGKGRLPGDPSQPPPPRRTGLLDQLPAKLRAYGKSLDPSTDRVLVLVDLDNDTCVDLKRRLLSILGYCHPPPTVFFRIAIEEMEAFFLGDAAAIRRAFPTARMNRLSNYVQDSICGTWELFQDVVRASVDDKPEWARRMAPHLGIAWRGPDANRSSSFRHLCRALRMLAGEPVD